MVQLVCESVLGFHLAQISGPFAHALPPRWRRRDRPEVHWDAGIPPQPALTFIAPQDFVLTPCVHSTPWSTYCNGLHHTVQMYSMYCVNLLCLYWSINTLLIGQCVLMWVTACCCVCVWWCAHVCLCFLCMCRLGLSVVSTYRAVCLDLGCATKLSHHQFKASLRSLKWGHSCPDINNLYGRHNDFGNKWYIDKHVWRTCCKCQMSL